VRALLAPYHQRLRSELERFGGTVEKFIGDAVVALFGAPQTKWLEAARALADGDFRHAVEIYEITDAMSDTAAAQLYAARKLVEAGRRAEAELYLQPALAFYRSVRATGRVRRAEALLAATA
jgi:class 3 adenylate cyclase